ncbi:hypothetical protein ACKWTF_014215 [Chironomus riparius]
MTPTFNSFIYIFVLIISRCSSQSVSLIGSRFVSNNSTYKAYLLTNGLSDDSLVHVGFGPKGGDLMIVKDVDQSPLKELSFDVPSDDITDYELSISSKLKSTCREQSVNLFKNSNIPIIFIQFSKPIYKTSEIFNFKIFILSQKLLPMSKFRGMNVKIVNPRGVVWSHDKVSEVSKYGIYENSMKLWDIPNFGENDLGIWTINVEVDGKKASKSFEVQYISKDDTEVFVQVPSEIAFEDRRIYVNIFTKDPKNRYAAFFLTAKFVNSSRIEIDKHIKSEYLTDTKTVIMLDFKQDFGINFPSSDMILTLRVDIVQNKKTTTIIKDVKMKQKERHKIQIVRKKYFKPGFKFSMKIRVKLLDGKSDNSLNQLSTTIKYLSSKNGPAEEKSFQTNLKNGDAVHVLQPKAKTTKIIVQLKFADTELIEEIDKLPGVEEYLQVTMLSKSTKVGSTVQMKAQTTEEMEQLNVLIFGTKGIVHTKTFDDAIGKDVFEFPLELTDEMRPEARGLVFYTRASDGAIVYDEFSLSIGFSVNNSLDISAPETAEPNQMMNIEVKTEKDSQVFLVAVDANSELYNGDSGVSRLSVYNEIAYHLNRKFSNPSNYQFEKLNGFILEPHKNGQNCNSGQSKEDKELLESQSATASSQKYFPDTIPELSFIAASEIQTVQMKIPDSTTKWKIYGISVHPTKGFTVSKTNLEISVKQSVKSGVQIEIDSPSNIRQDETYRIQIITKNLQPSYLTGIVTLNIEDGTIFEVKSEWNNKCLKYLPRKAPLTYNVQFTPQNSFNGQNFGISATSDKPVKITAKFESIKGKSEATTEVLVEAPEKIKTEAVKSDLIELNQKYPNFKLELPSNAKSVKTFVDVHGNLLGPALDGLEKMFGRQMFLDEEKVLKFQTAIINFKFLDSIGQSSHDKAKAAKLEIFEGGKEAVNILRNISKDKTKLWFSAFIIGILKDAEGLFLADQKLIADSLNFIATQQLGKQYKNAGSFAYYQDTDDHKDIGAGMREYIQNALIISTFLKDNNTMQRYKDYILNSLNYSYSKNREFRGDLVNVIMAYTFAQFGSKQHVAEFIKKLNHGYATPNAQALKKHHSMYVEVISYLILTKILINEDPRAEVERLLAFRKVNGQFYSPYDTTLAFKALFEYSKYKNSGKSFVLKIDGQPNMIGQLETKTFGPFSDPRHELIITTQGLGYATIHQEFDDNKAQNKIISTLSTAAKKTGKNDDQEISFSFKYSPFDQTLNNNLLVLEVEVPKGYKAMLGKQLQDIEFRNNGSTVVFYMHNIKKNIQYRSTMTVTRNKNEPEHHNQFKIKLYDYYRPNMIDIDLLCI